MRWVNDIARVSLQTSAPIHFDRHRRNRATGSFVLAMKAVRHRGCRHDQAVRLAKRIQKGDAVCVAFLRFEFAGILSAS